MHALWAALVAVLGNMVRSQIGFWIASALGAFGLHLVAQEFVVSPALAEIQSHLNGLPATGLAWLAHLKVDRVVTILLSAYAAAASLSAVRLRKAPPAA